MNSFEAREIWFAFHDSQGNAVIGFRIPWFFFGPQFSVHQHSRRTPPIIAGFCFSVVDSRCPIRTAQSCCLFESNFVEQYANIYLNVSPLKKLNMHFISVIVSILSNRSPLYLQWSSASVLENCKYRLISQ